MLRSHKKIDPIITHIFCITMTELIEEMNNINEYLIDFMKMSQIDWLVEDVKLDHTINKKVDNIFNELKHEAIDKNFKRVIEITNYLYDLEVIDEKFYMMIVNLINDEDYKQVVLAIDNYLLKM